MPVNIGCMVLEAGTLGLAHNYASQGGFDDGTMGTTVPILGLLGVVTGPMVADVVDRSRRVTQKTFIIASMVQTLVLLQKSS